MATSYAHLVCRLSDRDLMKRLREVARGGQRNTAELLFHLREVDDRRLCAVEADGSTFAYCVNVLHFSESEAFKRIGAARAARHFPEILDMVARGELHLTAVNLLASHLTTENHRELLGASVHRTKREIQELLAARFPQPDAKTSLRKLPEPACPRRVDASQELFTAAGGGLAQAAMETATAAGASAASRGEPSPAASSPVRSGSPASTGSAVAPTAFGRPPDRGSVAPLSPGRYRLQVTLSGETRDKLLHARDLLRHVQPDGDLAVVLDRAVTCLVEKLENRKFGKCKRPRREKVREEVVTGAEVVLEAVDGTGSGNPAAMPSAQVVPAAVDRTISGHRAAVPSAQMVPAAVDAISPGRQTAVPGAQVVPAAVDRITAGRQTAVPGAQVVPAAVDGVTPDRPAAVPRAPALVQRFEDTDPSSVAVAERTQPLQVEGVFAVDLGKLRAGSTVFPS